MAISCSSLTNGNSNSAASTYATASITPGTNHLILATCRNRLATGNGAVLPTLTGCSLTWVQVATKLHGGAVGTGNAQRLTTFRALGTPTTGTLTFDFGGTNQAECSWVVTDCSGTDTTGTNGSGAVANVTINGTTSATASPMTVTMGTFGSASDKTYGVAAGTGGGQTFAAGTSMTRLTFNPNGTNGEIADEWSNTNNNVSPVTMTYPGSTINWAIVGLEIVTASSVVNGTATPSGVAATSAETDSLGEPVALPSGTTASSAENNPLANPYGLPSGQAATSAENNPTASGAGIASPAGVSATSGENNALGEPVGLASGVAVTSAENDPLGMVTAMPDGVSATATEHDPAGENVGFPSGQAATASANDPLGIAAALSSGVGASASVNNPTASAGAVVVTGHACDHNAFDSNAFDTDGVAAQIFGGVPRPFFSYSHNRLAWSETPLVPQIIPPTLPPVITGYVALSRTGGSIFAVGTVTFSGTVQAKHQAKQRVSVTGIYTPQAISAESRTGRGIPVSIRAHGDVFDWDLLAAALLMDAA